MEEVEGGIPDVRPIAGRSGGLPREHTRVQLPARAPFADRAVLSRNDDRVRGVEDRAAFDTLCRNSSQILPARHTARRLVIDDLVGIEPHRQVLARSTRLLASVALHLVPPIRLRLGPTIATGLGGLGLMLGRIGRRWER
jgi:hypothetical protein